MTDESKKNVCNVDVFYSEEDTPTSHGLFLRNHCRIFFSCMMYRAKNGRSWSEGYGDGERGRERVWMMARKGESMVRVIHLRHGAAVVGADGDEGGAVAVTVALGSVLLGVAQLAVDLAVRSVAGGHGVQRSVALAAVVAGLVPLLGKGAGIERVRGGLYATMGCVGWEVLECGQGWGRV